MIFRCKPLNAVDAGKEGMIGIYLADHMFKSQTLFFSLIGLETIFMVCCLLITCHISTGLGRSLSGFLENHKGVYRMFQN